MTQTLFPIADFTGKQLRDEALERVLEHAGDDWREKAIAIVGGMSGEVTGEDIRLACLERDVEPHHSNAWGGFIARLVKDETLTPTGRYVPMKAKGSHARKTQVYLLAANSNVRKTASNVAAAG